VTVLADDDVDDDVANVDDGGVIAILVIITVDSNHAIDATYSVVPRHTASAQRAMGDQADGAHQ
jgi:hypothetical protein